jgi:AAA+ ATPase superfamily predicted ATPase
MGLLDGQLSQVTKHRGGTRGGVVIITGRRRVGKSRLVREF